MTTFTMTLRELYEDDNNTFERYEETRPEDGYARIGLGDYQIFREEYRAGLNRSIYEQYMNREIGFETGEYFRLRVANHMRIHMPYFNKLYESLEIPFEILSTMDISTEASSDSSENAQTDVEGTTNANVGGKSKTVNHAFPQSAISGNEDYATAAVSVNSDNNTVGASAENTAAMREARDKNQSRTKGYQGFAPELIARYRDSLINVDALVIASLEQFFMSIWDVADNYTERNYYNGIYYPTY